MKILNTKIFWKLLNEKRGNVYMKREEETLYAWQLTTAARENTMLPAEMATSLTLAAFYPALKAGSENTAMKRRRRRNYRYFRGAAAGWRRAAAAAGLAKYSALLRLKANETGYSQWLFWKCLNAMKKCEEMISVQQSAEISITARLKWKHEEERAKDIWRKSETRNGEEAAENGAAKKK